MNLNELITKDDLSVLTTSIASQLNDLKDSFYLDSLRQLNEETFLTKEETSKLLRCSIPTVNRRVSQGVLIAYKIKGDTVKTAVRFKKSDVLNLFTPSSNDSLK
jgi:hypothetical protein